MTRTLILGAGGHAHVVADTLYRAREAGANATPIGYMDDDPTLHNTTILNLPVLGPIARLGDINSMQSSFRRCSK